MNELNFNVLKFRNFLSFGNTEQVIRLDGNSLTVILGENMDTGGENSRNGVGKSAISDALCYVLFGKVIRDIPNKNLVNHLIRRGQSMMVSLEFTKRDRDYLIERGEKPSVLRLFEKSVEDTRPFHTKSVERPNEFEFEKTESKKGSTTDTIINILGFDLRLFEFLVLNSSESLPFVKIDADKRKDIIEKLFNFTILSKRSDELKKERLEMNKTLVALEAELEATKQANARVLSEIEAMKARSRAWEEKKARAIMQYEESLEQLQSVDIEGEIDILTALSDLKLEISKQTSLYNDAASELRFERVNYAAIEKEILSGKRELDRLTQEIHSLDESECPTCHQHWEPDQNYRSEIADKLAQIQDEKADSEARLAESQKQILTKQQKQEAESVALSELDKLKQEIQSAELTFSSLHEATSAGARIDELVASLEREKASENPFTESLASLSENALKETDPEAVAEARKLVEHYNFLITLLSNDDSFLRKTLLNKWLPKLNQRINHYLALLELPHKVTFLPDMSMKITDYGQEFGWGNMSRGQRQRINLALDWAFQDIFEMLNYRINTLIVDEMIDNGICNRGASNAMATLRGMGQGKNKRVLLVTHREDIASQTEDQLIVKMQNKQSWIESQD